MPNRINSSSHSPEYGEMLRLNASRHTEIKTLEHLEMRREVLIKVGRFPLGADQTPLPLERLATYIASTFQQYRLAEQTDPINCFDTPEYRQAIKLLYLAGLIEPIILGDWEVDRVEEAPKNLGITSFKDLEQTILGSYGSGIVFDEGAGNFKSIEIRRQDNAKLPPEKHLEYFGIGNKGYFPIEKLLQRFVKPGIKADEFIEALGKALRKELKNLWYTPEGSTIRTWKQKVDFPDLNIIFQLLQNPKPWLEKWYSPETSKYKTSQEFEYDKEEEMPIDLHTQFLELCGYSDQQKTKAVRTIRLNFINARKHSFSEKLKHIKRLLKDLEKQPAAEVNQNILKWLKQFKKITTEDDLLKIPREYDQLLSFLQDAAKVFSNKINSIDFEIGLINEVNTTSANDTPTSPQNIYRQIFSADFVKTIGDVSGSKIDLNGYAPVYIKNALFGFFDTIPELIPSESCALINGVRADAHLNAGEFHDHIRRNLPLLIPGGVINVDGIRASYTRVLRFEEVMAAINNNPEYKAEIIINKKTRATVALLIQRNHPSGFFTDTDKARFIDPSNEVQPIDQVAQRPDIRVGNTIRRRLESAAKGNVHYFKGVHEPIHDQIMRLMALQTVKDEPERRPEVNLFYPEIYQKIISGEVPFSDRSVENVIDTMAAKINPLIRQARLIADPDKHLENPEQNTIYTFPVPRHNSSTSQINHCYRISANELATNQELDSLEFNLFIDERQDQIHKMIETLRRKKIRNPITLISFEECATNKLLAKKLDKLSGIGELVRHITINFMENNNEGFSSIDEKSAKLQEIEELMNEGGVLVCGGSLHDSYTETFYRDVIGRKLLDHVLQPESNLRLLNICFSAQVMSDVIGRRFFNGQLKTETGMLEIGPTPIDVLQAGRRHPWFQKFPAKVTMATTHTGHIINKFSPKKAISSMGIDVTPLMESNVTGLPLAWTAANDRILSTLVHPEIDLVDRHGNLSNDYQEIQEQFEATDLPYPKLMRRNWQQTINPETKKSRLVTNAGDAMLISGLWHLLKSIR